jgi:hypothetical protein
MMVFKFLGSLLESQGSNFSLELLDTNEKAIILNTLTHITYLFFLLKQNSHISFIKRLKRIFLNLIVLL